MTLPILSTARTPTSTTSDLHKFDQQFGLPDPPSFQKVNEFGQPGPLPGTDPVGPGGPGSWEVEESLDVEWVHSIAPKANIILVEANSPTDTDLIVNGVANAAKLPGVSAVSMSFGASEFSSDTSLDSIFQTPSGHNGVTFLASTGDQAAPGLYPAYSPNVVAVGGTSLFLNPDNSYKSESGWNGSGGGFSQFESQPPYQNVVTQNMAQRTIPDVSFDADPNTGVAIYDSYDFGAGTPWVQIGGTSLSCPCWAGLIAIVNQERVDTGGTTLDGPTQTLPALYELYSDPAKYSSDFHDITSGYNVYPAGTGYDLVTGIGTPIANQLVPDLAALNQNGGPTVATPASATPSTVTSTTTTLSVLGADDGGEANLTYTWAATTLPAGASAPTFSANGTNAAKQAVATFSKAGTYGFTVTIADAGGLTTTSSVNVAVNQSLASINISPSSVIIKVGSTQQFAATARDQFGNALATQPTFTWTTTVGRISTSGLLTAPSTSATGTVTAVSGSFFAKASVTVNSAPTVVTPASATPSPVTGTTTTLSVLGADDGGEANLTYTWAATTLPSGASAPTFSVNGTNAAKKTVATFSKAGTYGFTVTIADAGGLTTTSSVNVVVNQTLTSIAVSPASVTVKVGGTQQFTATARDQFGNAWPPSRVSPGPPPPARSPPAVCLPPRQRPAVSPSRPRAARSRAAPM